MPVRPFDDWAVGRTQSLPLSALKDSVIGIDASHYIQQHLVNQSTREALLGALGGFPFALKSNIEKELQALKSLGIGCVFVFNGLEFGKRDHRLSASPSSVRSFEQAWELYDQQQADQVVDAFSSAGRITFSLEFSLQWSKTPPLYDPWTWANDPNSPILTDEYTHPGTPPPETLFKFLRRILNQNGISSIVAPYSAVAQLAYLYHGPNPVVDSIYAPSEAFLFDIDKLITRIEAEAGQFNWLTKQTCQEELGRLSNEQFLEFLLLLGSSFLHPCPLFENPAFPGKLPNIRDALPMFNSAGRTALGMCAQYEEDRRMVEFQYVDRYKRAYMSVKHHVYMNVDGQVVPLEPETTSSDLHEIIGQRLPEELYFYLSKGLLGPDVPNYLTLGEVRLSLPLGAEDTEIFRQLVGDTLTPIRTQSICLLANSLHRFYQTKVIDIIPWFDESSKRKISLKGIPSVKETIQSWKISSSQFPESVKKLQAPLGSFKFAVQSLNTADFVPKSFATKETPVLSSQEDIRANVMWRFLQLRGYVDDKHKLTAWGKCLEQALSNVDPADNLEDAIFTAIEMLRFDLLNTKDWFSHVSGGPMRGSEDDKTFNMLVSRVACIAKLQHKSIGYSGPLSRQLLCYRSLISEVRHALRNLIEVVLTGLFLGGDANRDRKDWTEMAMKLPFIDDNDCGLGIAVRTYLDDLPLQADPTSPEARAEVKSKGKEWFQHSESFTGNLDQAFKLWDAVYKGTQTAGNELKDTKLWDNANKWLSDRR
ncbi:XPG N-terminal [Penicillium lividum]|nr:XPG N-terminal [Penicillium lividum]